MCDIISREYVLMRKRWEFMQPRKLIEFFGVVEKLKCNTRHSWTSNGRQESVAEHSWGLAIMAMLVADEFPDIDIEKVLKMCVIHDLGEAITGDIPAFDKTNEDEKAEDKAIEYLLKLLPDDISNEFSELVIEMNELSTEEAKLVKALDKLEVLVEHNISSLDTWMPKEYSLNLVHGDKYVEYSEYLKLLREEIRKDTIEKIK